MLHPELFSLKVKLAKAPVINNGHCCCLAWISRSGSRWQLVRWQQEWSLRPTSGLTNFQVASRVVISYFDATGLVMQHLSTLEATQMMLESVVHGIPDTSMAAATSSLALKSELGSIMEGIIWPWKQSAQLLAPEWCHPEIFWAVRNFVACSFLNFSWSILNFYSFMSACWFSFVRSVAASFGSTMARTSACGVA